MADRTARRDDLRRGNDSIGINAIVPVELVDRTGLTKMLHAKWANAVATDGAEPRQSGGMPVQQCDETAMPWQVGK